MEVEWMMYSERDSCLHAYYVAASEEDVVIENVHINVSPEDDVHVLSGIQAKGSITIRNVRVESKQPPTHRIRRGKLVEIPEQWRGKVVYKQTKRKRNPISRRTRGSSS